MIPLIGTRPVSVLRRGAPSLDPEGRRVQAATTTIAIIATVQPVSARAARWLPDGVRVEDTIALASYSEVRGYDETTGADADDLVIPGLSGVYSVLTATHSAAFGGQPGHWMIHATRRQPRQP